jgi:acyl-ACP thioesterase
MIYTEEYRINSHDCDLNGNVKPSAILRYMHETANLQLKKYGPSNDELRQENKAFILSKINLSFYSTLQSFDIIRVETWAAESKGVSFYRCSRVFKGQDLIAEMVAVFALVNTKEGRLCKVSDITFGFETESAMLELDLPARFRIPEDTDMRLLGEYTVRYSDTDMNMHMNNANYLDVFCDYLPNNRHNRIITAVINYQAEAPLDCTVKIYRGHDDDGAYYFRTVRDDGKVNTESFIMTDRI